MKHGDLKPQSTAVVLANFTMTAKASLSIVFSGVTVSLSGKTKQA